MQPLTSDNNGSGDASSRRQFLGVSALSGAAGFLSEAVSAKAATSASSNVAGAGFDPDLVLLIDRITGGFSLADYQYAESLGYDAYLAEQLNYETLIGANDPALQAKLVDYDIQNMSSLEILIAYNPMNMSFNPLRQATTIQIMWQVYGRAQLYYRMFQFWNQHLNIDINSSTTQRFILWAFLRDKVLANAMTSVPELIQASSQGAAMLFYLNNNTNVASAPNENYAREVMELHTLGVDNGYTQTDIEELARILTGWSVCLSAGGCSGGTYEYGDFRFITGTHDTGDKMLLGNLIQGQSGAAGMNEGIEAITILTEHPNTADYISRKLCRHFLGGINYSYDPPEDVVQMVKWTYLNSNPIGDIRSMLSVMLQKDVLTNASTPKFRRPLDLTTSSLRAVGADLSVSSPGFLSLLSFYMDSMGMHPNFWGPPNGPFDSKTWSEGGAIPRWSYLDALSRGSLTDVVIFSVTNLLISVNASAPGTQAQGLNELLTGGRMTQKEVEAIQDFIGFGTASESRLKEALGLAMSLPTYQFI